MSFTPLRASNVTRWNRVRPRAVGSATDPFPGRPGLGSGDLKPFDLAATILMAPGREEHDGAHDPADLVDFGRQSVRSEDHERARLY